MSNFIFSLNVTIPIFLMILLGYIIRKMGIISDGFVSAANKYVFLVALPVMLFKDISETDVADQMTGDFLLFCMIVTIVMFLLVWLLTYLFVKDKTMVGAFAQAGVRGSAAVLGVAFVENICGNSGMAPMMIASEEERRQIRSKNIKKAFINILKNPIILGILAGLLFSLSGLSMPAIPAKTITYISNTATPIALIAIGGGFDKNEALGRLKPAIAASAVKLIVLPAVFLPLALLMKFAPSEIAAILVMLASPTTVSCYVMADNMKNDKVLTSNVILITTILSSVTLTMWVFILKSFGAL